MMRVACFLSVFILLPALAASSTWLIEPDGSGDYPDIQTAILQSASGDTILLADGVFTGSGNRGLDFGGKFLVVRSAGGDPSACTIDCQAMDRAFHFSHQEGSDCLVAGITMTGGRVSGSGHSASGGAIYCEAGSGPSIQHCRFVDNLADGGGGRGGALVVHSSTVVVSECEFIGNAAPMGLGGAVVAKYSGSVTANYCLFENNTALEGGAVEAYNDSQAKVIGCTLVANDATLGGALCCWGGSSLFVSQCTIAGNTADDASAICVPEGSGYGPCPVTVSRSLIVGGSTRAIYCGTTSVFQITCTDIYANQGGNWSSCAASMFGVDGNISEDPLFCEADQPYSIRSDSPCAPEHNPECGLIGAWPVACDPPTGIEPVAGADASHLALAACEPNPFRNFTRIEFTVPPGKNGSLIRLTVYDSAGRVVRKLATNTGSTGRGSVTWDGRDDAGQRLPAGIFFCRLQGVGPGQTSRLVLLSGD